MLILLDCRPLQKAGASSETTWCISKCISELTAGGGVEWLFLLEKGGEDLVLPAGRRVVRKGLAGGLGTRLWYGWVVPRVMRHNKADVVMTSANMGGKATGAGESAGRAGWCRWVLAGGELILSYRGREVRAPLAPYDGVKPLGMEERERVKEKIAGGREYFFADVTRMGAMKVMDLLKAFSLFKKRQLSNMKLVLAGAGTIDKLDSYKYREDVCLYGEGVREQMEGAYAIIYLPRRNDTGMAVLNAFRAWVPVIMLTEGGKGADEAVLPVAAGDITALAEALKSVYKDESFRNGLIGKGEVRVAGLHAGLAAEAMRGLLGI